MSNRLNQEREKELQPKRIKFALDKLKTLGFEPEQMGKTKVIFKFKGCIINFFPYSGWFSGKTVKDGRGIFNLLKQLKNQ